MHKEFFGDAYDYAKRVILHAIAKPDEWIVHPMLFRSTGGGEKGGGLSIAKYAAFLGLPCSAVPFNNKCTRDRIAKDVACYRNRYLFLDPDTGIKQQKEGTVGTKHITMQQLREITQARKGKIVLIFDHAFDYGDEAQEKVSKKLELLCGDCEPKMFGAAVIVRKSPCVCFIWLSTERKEVDKVTQKLRDTLPIPTSKIVPIPSFQSG